MDTRLAPQKSCALRKADRLLLDLQTKQSDSTSALVLAYTHCSHFYVLLLPCALHPTLTDQWQNEIRDSTMT